MSFISYAQNYEDVILMRALRGVEAGFYIDVGAQHPRYDSVTKVFYDLGWNGINIEPVESWHRTLAEARPRDINLCLAAGASEGSIELHETDASGLSTSVAEFARRHREQGHELRSRSVPMSTLDRIWDEHAPGQVHFLKIDVEGAEGDVLRGLDLSRHRPWIILVEATEPNARTSTHVLWESLLTSRDYRFVYEDGLNRFYLAKEHESTAGAFGLPPNFFDDFIRREYVDRDDELQLKIREGEALAQRQDDYIRGLVATVGEKNEALAGLVEHQAKSEAYVASLRETLARREGNEIRLMAELQAFAQRHEQDLSVRRELESMLADSAAHSRRLDAEIERLQAHSRIFDAEVERLQARLASRELRLEQSELSGARLSRMLVDAQSAQSAATAALAESIASHGATLNELGRAQQDFAAVIASSSWRITAPLRHSKAFVKSMLAPVAGFARRMKRRLRGTPAAVELVGPQAELVLTVDAEAILARCPVQPDPDATGVRR